jgi:hypothetical protein
MGNRARQCTEQAEICEPMGLRFRNRGYEHKETIRTRVEGELGEGRHCPELPPEIPRC